MNTLGMSLHNDARSSTKRIVDVLMVGVMNRAREISYFGGSVNLRTGGTVWVRPGVTDEQRKRLVEIVTKLITGQEINRDDKEFLDSLPDKPYNVKQ